MEPTRPQPSPEGNEVGAGGPGLAAVTAIVLGSSRPSGVGRAGALMGWIQLALMALILVVALVATFLVPSPVELLRAP